MTVDSGSIKTALGECWGEEAATPLCSGKSWVEGGCQAGWGRWGDTAHAQLSSAHTHTDLRQENGSSLNLTILAINFLPVKSQDADI